MSYFDPFSVSLLLMLSFSSLTYLFVSIWHFLSLGLSWRVQRRRSQSPCLCATSASACWCVQWEAVSSWGWTLASDMAASWQFSHLLVSKHKNVQKWTHCQLSLGFASQCSFIYKKHTHVPTQIILKIHFIAKDMMKSHWCWRKMEI